MPQYFDSTAAFPMKTKKSVYAKGGRAKYYGEEEMEKNSEERW